MQIITKGKVVKEFFSNWIMGKIVTKYTTKASFEKVVGALEEAVNDHDFSIIAVHDMRETYTKKNLPITDDFQYQIFHLCNAPKSHKALTTMSYDMGVMMPKSIIIAREGDVTTLRYMTMKPWMVSMMFPRLDIVPMSAMVTKVIKEIIEEDIEHAEE